MDRKEENEYKRHQTSHLIVGNKEGVKDNARSCALRTVAFSFLYYVFDIRESSQTTKIR